MLQDNSFGELAYATICLQTEKVKINERLGEIKSQLRLLEGEFARRKNAARNIAATEETPSAPTQKN